MEEFLALVKGIAFRRLTASDVVNKRSAYLFAAHLVAAASGDSKAIIREGVDISGEPKITLSALNYASDRAIFVPPVYFEKGIYVQVGAGTSEVLLQFKQAGDMGKLAMTRSLKSYIPPWLGGPKKEKEKA
jgi:hypothetical protein